MSMSGPSNSGGGMMSEINVTPMVDVMLVLLVNQGGTFPSPLAGHSPTSLPPPRVPRASF
jgi:biopolymer transport protein ExbD